MMKAGTVLVHGIIYQWNVLGHGHGKIRGGTQNVSN